MRTITDLPDDFDPVVIIEERMEKCPICGGCYNSRFFHDEMREMMDSKGRHHKILKWLNKYLWERKVGLKCENCGCQWDTGWYPADHSMFEVKVTSDEISNYEVTVRAFAKIIKRLGLDKGAE